MNKNYEYKVGGSLAGDAPSYVVRQADSDLYQSLLEGELCYVFNSRQMGKSSLVVRTRTRLLAAGITCVTIDISGLGSQEINIEQWYTSIVYTIVTALKFMQLEDFLMWWDARTCISPMLRFDKFIEEVLLAKVRSSIVIFIDEIDSVLSLDFPTGDFFALIRSCYNKRSQNPEYNRLTFALVGVATPSNLIADKKRTPFNIGRAIQLHGFKFHEIGSLSRGLEGKVNNPQAVMQAILSWTGGQPFLTQKLCQLLVDYLSQTLAGRDAALREEFSEVEAVKRVVRSQIIKNWESQDEPPHLRTIRDRILNNEQRASRLLDIYQQILHQGEILTDDSPEQLELRLSGLVVEHEGKLRVYNQIYELVFVLGWVGKALAKVRPYATTIESWVTSDKDESWLLGGQELRDAQIWAVNKSLSDLDYQFLAASQELAKREVQIALDAERQAKQILTEAQQKAELALEEEKQANQRLAKTQEKTKWQMAIGASVLGLSLVGAVVVVGDANQRLNSAISGRNAADQERDTAYQQRRDAISQLNDKKLELDSRTLQLETAKKQVENARNEAQTERNKKQLIVAEKANLEQEIQQLQQKMQGVMKQVSIATENRDKVLQQVKHKTTEVKKVQAELKKEQQRVGQANNKLAGITANLNQVNQERQKAEQRFQEATQTVKLAEANLLEAKNQLKQAVETVLQGQTLVERLITITDTETPLTIRKNHGEVTESYKNFLERVRNLLKDSSIEAQVLSSIGNTSFEASEYQKALESFLQALKLYKAAGDRIGEGRTLSKIGTVYSSLGQYQKALEYYHQALVIIKKLDVRAAEADLLNNIGVTYRVLGQYDKSLEFSEGALELRKMLLGNEHPDVASSLNNLAFLYYSTGNYTQALSLYQHALAIQEKVLGAEHLSTAISLNNLARLYQAQGNYTQALALYQRALEINRQVGDRAGEGQLLNAIGDVYSHLGQNQKVFEFYQQSLAIARAIDSKSLEANVLAKIGVTYSALGDYNGAIENFNQLLQLNPNHADAYYNRGLVRANLRDYKGAIGDFNQALQLNPNHADAYYNRNIVRAKLDDYKKTNNNYAESTLFFCQQNKGVFVTYARTSSGRKIPLIRWNSVYSSDSFGTGQQRCQVVSRRFQRNYDNGTLKNIKVGTLRGQPVVCAAINKSAPCTNETVLFTLRHNSNANLIVRQLLDHRGLAAGSVIDNNCKGDCSITVDMNEYLNNATVETEL